jgi:hypothetical protein
MVVSSFWKKIVFVSGVRTYQDPHLIQVLLFTQRSQIFVEDFDVLFFSIFSDQREPCTVRNMVWTSSDTLMRQTQSFTALTK